MSNVRCSLQLCHDERDGVSNHQPDDCLLTPLFSHRSKKTSKLCVTGLCAGNSPVTGEFPAQRASNAKNVSIWWRHDVLWCMRYRVIVDHVITSLNCTKPDWELNSSVISYLKCICIAAPDFTSKWGIFREPGVVSWYGYQDILLFKFWCRACSLGWNLFIVKRLH